PHDDTRESGKGSLAAPPRSPRNQRACRQWCDWSWCVTPEALAGMPGELYARTLAEGKVGRRGGNDVWGNREALVGGQSEAASKPAGPPFVWPGSLLAANGISASARSWLRTRAWA